MHLPPHDHRDWLLLATVGLLVILLAVYGFGDDDARS
jgi:hypothetical protein